MVPTVILHDPDLLAHTSCVGIPCALQHLHGCVLMAAAMHQDSQLALGALVILMQSHLHLNLHAYTHLAHAHSPIHTLMALGGPGMLAHPLSGHCPLKYAPQSNVWAAWAFRVPSQCAPLSIPSI